ncbi:MAG: phage terminase large subunit [Patescibacteria group bacterium]
MKKIENLQNIIKSSAARRKLAYESHYFFFHIYFGHYIGYDTADFQKEMFALTESDSVRNTVIVAFRGSGKSTIMNMSLPIWSILGKRQCKYVVIVGFTQEQAKRHLKNIKQELENNTLLMRDLGPFKEIEDEWNSYTLEIPNFGARITAVSIDQSIRGTRHGAHRPDLIICDDVEDINSVKTLEGRDKVDDAITSEIIPAGTPDTRLVVIGNLLHEDSFIMRLKGRIQRKEFNGEFRAYPLLDDKENCLWPAKFPSEESILNEKKRIGKESSWQREYMLNIVTNTDRIIFPKWIHYYTQLPEKDKKNREFKFRKVLTGIDLAISQNQKADCTAMVSAQVHGYGEKMAIYILPNPINSRLTFEETINTAKNIHDAHEAKLIVEDVAYQKAAIETLKNRGCIVEGVTPRGDKSARLMLVSHLFERGQILFPEQGCEKLIQQLLNFGLERHDDLVDALTMLITFAAQEKQRSGLMLAFLHNDGSSTSHYLDRTEYEDRFGYKRVQWH